MEISTSILVTLYVIMLGPLKLIGPYALVTAGADSKLRLKIINKAVIVSTITALLLAVLAGYLVSKLNLSLGILAVIMGIYMLVWAFANSLGRIGDDATKIEEISVKLALFPLAFPGIIPAHGIALLILSSTLEGKSNWFENIQFTLVLIVSVMLINWLFMLALPRLLKFTGVIFWKVLGRVLAVILSAAALQIIYSGMKLLNIF